MRLALGQDGVRVAPKRNELVLLVVKVDARKGHPAADLARRALCVQVLALCAAGAEELGAHVGGHGVNAGRAEGCERDPGDAVDHLGVSVGGRSEQIKPAHMQSGR